MGNARPCCVVVTCFNEGQPGFLDFQYRLKALASRYDVSIVSNISLSIPEFQDIEMSRYVLPSEAGTVGWLRYLWRCRRWMDQFNPAIVVLLNSSAAPILVMGQAVGASILYWNEHPTHMAPSPGVGHPIRSLWRFLIRALMFEGARKANVVMPIGEAHRDDLIARGCLQQKVRMIYMGVADQFASVRMLRPSVSHEEVERPLELIYVGSVNKERGRDVMIEALGLVNRGCAKPRAKLTIIGAQPNEIEACRALAKCHDVGTALEVFGRIPGGEVPSRLVGSDMGICLWEDKPWYQFNPPTKLFEYLSAGLPVLASNIRTHTEYVKSWENGVIFDYGAAGLAFAINQILARKKELRAMSDRAFASGQNYLWSRIEPHFTSTVSELISSSKYQS